MLNILIRSSKTPTISAAPKSTTTTTSATSPEAAHLLLLLRDHLHHQQWGSISRRLHISVKSNTPIQQCLLNHSGSNNVDEYDHRYLLNALLGELNLVRRPCDLQRLLLLELLGARS